MEAIAREKQLKGWSRKKEEALISENYELLQELSKKHPSTSSGWRPFELCQAELVEALSKPQGDGQAELVEAL